MPNTRVIQLYPRLAAVKKPYVQYGFTLIELMIVVAIIAILAGIAIPSYSEYQSKAKFAAGLAEISTGRTAFELLRNSGSEVTEPADAGLDEITANCGIETTSNSITCNLVGAPAAIDGRSITVIISDTAGEWSCNTTVPKKYTTKSCPGI